MNCKNYALYKFLLIVFIFVFYFNFSFAGTSPTKEDIKKCQENTRIEEPKDKTKGNGYPLEVKGKACNLPKGYHMWLIVHPITSSGYYPQVGEISPSPRDNSWDAMVWIGADKKGTNEDYYIILAIATDDGHKKFVDYINNAPKDGYPEISLPDDVIQIDRITFTRTN
jgi:hypothetical protein